MSSFALNQKQLRRPASMLVGFGLGSLVQGGSFLLSSMTIPKYVASLGEITTSTYVVGLAIVVIQLMLATELLDLLVAKFLCRNGYQVDSGEENEDLPAFGINGGKDLDNWTMSKSSSKVREMIEVDIFGGAILGVLTFGASYYTFFL